MDGSKLFSAKRSSHLARQSRPFEEPTTSIEGCWHCTLRLAIMLCDLETLRNRRCGMNHRSARLAVDFHEA